jgi:glyoxylase-like metal-dependent hydrolase (beta-lactamase superfamily II)
VPKAAAIPPFEVAKIGPRTWAGRFGISNCGWVELGSGVLVIDTGASEQDTANLQTEIQKTTGGKPIKWIVMTHLHGHANTGLPAFLQATATLYVHGSVVYDMEKGMARMAGPKAPKMFGVMQSVVISDGGQSAEVFAPKVASTGADLWVFVSGSKVAFVGDLVSTGRCPAMTDRDADPVAWGAEITKIQQMKPAVVVGSTGDTATAPEGELVTAKTYLERIYRVAKDAKEQDLPEAFVSSQLSTVQKIGDYCPASVDVLNGLAIYRRLGKDGKLQRGADQSAPRPGKP